MLNLSFFPESEKAEKGIITYFRKRGVLERFITTFGSPQLGSYVPNNILDLNPNNFYASSESTLHFEQHVGLTFLHHSFIPISFTLCQYDGEGLIPKTFNLEASLTTDGNDWEVISSKDSDDFCVVGILPTFHIDRIHWKPFKRFRIIRSGTDCRGYTYLRVGGIELFGQLIGTCNLLNPCTLCIKGQHIFYHILFFTLIQAK